MSVTTTRRDDETDESDDKTAVEERYGNARSSIRKKRIRRKHIESLGIDLSSHRTDRLFTWLDRDDDVTFTVSTRNGVKLADPRYQDTTRASYDSQAQVMQSWQKLKFPKHNKTTIGKYRDDNDTHMAGSWYGELYSSRNFQARQYLDGTGEVWHYATRAAIRTRHGIVINNSQDFGAGFARLTQATNSDGRLPLDGIQELLDEQDIDADIFDIESVHTYNPELSNSSRVRRPRLAKLSGDKGGVVVVRDETTKDRDSRLCGFHVTADEIRNAETVKDLERLLQPREVRIKAAEGMDIVGVNSMVPNPGGWNNSSRYADRGDVIQRQGEWYFIPCESGPESSNVSHTTSLPRSCDGCGASKFNVGDSSSICKECGHRHYDTDTHFGWKESLESHEPTKFLPADETAPERVAGYVKGTARHSRNEHYMGRFGDTWHKAVTHGRDVLVFDMSTQGNGGSRGFD